jgi:hypothetical protein
MELSVKELEMLERWYYTFQNEGFAESDDDNMVDRIRTEIAKRYSADETE